MDDAREGAGDVRSPKRQALAPLTPAHAPSTGGAALDDAIWTSIIEFLPIPKDLHPKNEKHYDATGLPVVTTWHTLLNLRLVTKELAALLHPRDNAALWQRLVLQSFDFSVGTGDGFNPENFMDDNDLDEPSRDEVEGEKVGEAWTEQDPQRVAMRGRYDMPSVYLEEDLVEWSNLGIYHRPSQYGFLTTLQQQPPEGEWPSSEDPFTLFGDLVRLLHLPHGEYMEAGGEGSDTTFKFLAAPAEADASSAALALAISLDNVTDGAEACACLTSGQTFCDCTCWKAIVEAENEAMAGGGICGGVVVVWVWRTRKNEE